MATPAGSNPLPHDGVEVDEGLAAQQLVELGLAGAVARRHPRQGTALVRRVVVDVHAGVRPPPREEVVDEILREPLLRRVVVRPPRHERARAIAQPREILDPPPADGPRVALEVEVDVGRIRLRQQPEPEVRRRVEQVVDGVPGLALG